MVLCVAAVSACAPDAEPDEQAEGSSADAVIETSDGAREDGWGGSDDGSSGDATADGAGMDARGDAALDARADARLDARGDAAASDARVDAGVDTRPIDGGTCPADMVLVAGRVCVDRYEAALVEVLADGTTRDWSPFLVVPDGRRVRAVSRANVVPQGYISGAQSARACMEAGKRLCSRDEWLAACRGPALRIYPYGNSFVAGACNVGRPVHPLISFYGRSDPSIYTFTNMNNPGINQQPDSLARTGQYDRCVSQDGLFDMHGNLHEWIVEPDGTFKGGFYADTNTNGAGCLYTTTAHGFTYHDYSTGFRCCADPR
jgi:hypothetical protein